MSRLDFGAKAVAFQRNDDLEAEYLALAGWAT
jgi:hypothetical protein